MFRGEAESSSGSNTSTKGDEVELVSRFLAPLCARDEAARNIALEAARSTVEGWLGGVGSPNHWEEAGEMDDGTADRFAKSQDGRYDIESHVQRSPTKSVPRIMQHRQPSYGSEGFFPQSVTEAPVFPEDGNAEGKLSSSFDRADGPQISNSLERRRLLADGLESYKSGNSSSDEGKTHCRLDTSRRFRLREEALDPSEDSFEQSRKHSSTRNSPGEANFEERQSRSKNVVKVKGSRQKQSEDNELDSGTRIYGKSPKFDDEGSIFESRNHGFRTKSTEGAIVDEVAEVYHSGVVFNTLEGFEDDIVEKFEDEDCARNIQGRKLSAGQIKRPLLHDENMTFDGLGGFSDEKTCDDLGMRCGRTDRPQDFQRKKDERKFSLGQIKRPFTQDESMALEGCNEVQALSKENICDEGMQCARALDFQRKNEERKFSAGQIKRPLSQDEEQEVKSGRVIDSPEVTPGDVGRLLNLGNALDGPRQAQPNKYLSLVTLHLPVILRLSVNCPFQNVRIKCAEILDMVKDRGLPVPYPAFDGPSAFVPTSELPDLNNLDEKTHILLMDAFLQNNRLDHVSRVMSSHPSYLEHFLRTQHFILRGDGPLPYDYRHLIAIMAAGRHQCSYLINLQKGEFLLQGGDPSWLQGLRSIPSKLQDLYEINKILAHRPWLLNKTHIEKLTKGADNWSLAEVVHAIVLLAHFHSLSSFVFSCGINEELDNVAGHHYKEDGQGGADRAMPTKEKLISSSPKKIPNGDGKTETQTSPPSSPSSPSIVGEQEVGVETLMERMKRLSEKSESYQITQEELSKRFETVETQSAELAAAPQRNSTVLDSDIGLFIEDPSFIYQDFAKRGQLNDIPTFRVQDYSWDDHGYSLVNRLYNDVGNLLDDKFKTAYNLTYYTMGQHSKVDTSRFRRAIWNYIQCMFGIRHDDYDYNEVNQLLERSLKTFIKSAVCYPERVTKRDYDRVMREFKHSEKVHVNLMILEARMQAELLYALRAVMRYMT